MNEDFISKTWQISPTERLTAGTNTNPPLRGELLNEQKGLGTPFQKNAEHNPCYPVRYLWGTGHPIWGTITPAVRRLVNLISGASDGEAEIDQCLAQH